MSDLTGSPAALQDQNELPEYLSQQILTYIGNKRQLLGFIGEGVRMVQGRLGRSKLSCFDVFSGSGIVARYLKGVSRRLVVNDIENYSRITNTCYLANPSQIDLSALKDALGQTLTGLEPGRLSPGFLTQLYAPAAEAAIAPGERVFFTRRNAMYLDTARKLINGLPPSLQPFLLAPLLYEASVHANTSGVFKGFYKDAATGVGKFGGTQGDALRRILGPIELKHPVFSRFECEMEIRHGDANQIAPQTEEVDLAYLDPPYNQHPYGSNYFMLNLIADYREPGAVSPVSGIPADWQRSDYNRRGFALFALKDLLEKLRAKFVLISFNSEGFITREQMIGLLGSFGRVRMLETTYNTFRGSRNLRDRNIHVKEYLYLLER